MAVVDIHGELTDVTSPALKALLAFAKDIMMTECCESAWHCFRLHMAVIGFIGIVSVTAASCIRLLAGMKCKPLRETATTYTAKSNSNVVAVSLLGER